MKRLALASAVLISLYAGQAKAAVVFYEDFEGSGPVLASGVSGMFTGAGTIQSTQDLGTDFPVQFGVSHLKNDGQLATILTLTGLGANHGLLSLSFNLAMWDSIDYDNGGPAADQFQVSVDGVFGYNDAFGNYVFGAPGDQDAFGYTYANGGSIGPGTLITPAAGGSFTVPQYGYNTGHRDTARAVTLNFSHSSDTAIIVFQFPNSQGGDANGTPPFDEAFGIDNVSVDISGDPPSSVPEPTSMSLLGLGAAGMLGLRLRRRKADAAIV